jgi:hypothetical protein
MKNADKKMPDSFYEWLNDCPVAWFRGKVDSDSVEYSFEVEGE